MHIGGVLVGHVRSSKNVRWVTLAISIFDKGRHELCGKYGFGLGARIQGSPGHRSTVVISRGEKSSTYLIYFSPPCGFFVFLSSSSLRRRHRLLLLLRRLLLRRGNFINTTQHL